MKLIYTATQQPVAAGDTVTLRDNVKRTVAYFAPPHKPDSEGKVTLKDGDHDHMGREYYVSVIGAEWIGREDRPQTTMGE